MQLAQKITPTATTRFKSHEHAGWEELQEFRPTICNMRIQWNLPIQDQWSRVKVLRCFLVLEIFDFYMISNVTSFNFYSWIHEYYIDILEVFRHFGDSPSTSCFHHFQAKDFNPKINTPELLEAGYTAKELHLVRQKTPELHMSVGGWSLRFFELETVLFYVKCCHFSFNLAT